MRKLYSTLMLVMLTVLGIQAQVASLDQLSNQKAYTIASARCFFQVVDGYDYFVTSTGSVEGIATDPSAESANQQFAILKGDTDYYLYSVGAQKFVNNDGSLVAAPSLSTPVTVTVGSSTDYPFMMNYSGNYINTQVSGSGYANGYVINSWNTADAGNQFKVVEAADVDLSAAISAIDNFEHNAITVTVRYSLCYGGTEYASYETTTKGAAPLTVTFDAPQTYLGATCADGTRASEVANETKTINVVYNYTLNAAELPIVPTTIKDGVFADSTKWYYLNPAKKTTYVYYSASQNQNNGGLSQTKNVSTAPADAKYFFAFTGNPLAGYQIRSYSAGATKGATVANPSSPSYVYVNEAPSNFLMETGSGTDQYRFHFADYDETGLAYLEGYYDDIDIIAYSWSSGWTWYAQNESTGQFYIQEVSDEMLKLATGGQASITSVDPEEGNVKSLSEINITFDQPLYRVYAYDHEGRGMDGEDEPKVITLSDGSETAATIFNFEDDAYGYEINEENPNLLTIYFERPLTTEGTYTLQIPSGLVYTEGGLTNAAKNITYIVTGGFEPVTVTARVYNAPFGDFSGTAWPSTLLPYDETFGYYTIKAQVTTKQEVTFLNYTGASGENLKVNFNTTDGTINLIDGEEPDSYGSYWANSSVLDGNYTGYYLYFSPSYCNIDFNTEDGVGHGTASLLGYEYATWTPYNLFIEFYLDNRFANESLSIPLVSSTPADNTTVESLQTISLTFERELTEVYTDKEITLTNDAGQACGGTITCSQNATNKAQVDITLSEAVASNGTFTLTVPSGIGAREADNGAGYTEAVTLTFKIGTGTAATWVAKAIDYIPSDCTNPIFAEGGKFQNITICYYESSRTYVIDGFMGDPDHDLTIKTNENDSILTINGQSQDSYGSMSVYTGNDNYYFGYIYPDECTYSFDKDKGYLQLRGYFYVDENDNGTWYTYAITWDADVMTGINSVEANKVAGRGIYNLAGQKMNSKNLKAGIYLKDGKKVVIK